ncbi:MAG: GH3 auxin-responsive promoter family protein [Rhodothermia bacterium]|nr:MAG: GH3 auxin-responsive promoter family protein [Rhodothermia bacterium]
MRRRIHFTTGPWKAVATFIAEPERTQRDLLQNLVYRARDTEWGRRLGFSEIACAHDVVTAYQSGIPLHDYEDYRSDIERVRGGEENVFWPDGFKHFAVSSGTVSEGTIIPISREMLRINRRFSFTTAWNYMKSTGHMDIARGRVLSVPGRVEKDKVRPDALIGEVSGLLASTSPWILRTRVEAVPRAILNHPNWDEKLNAIVDLSMEMDIRAIVMVPSWAIVLFKKLIARYNSLSNARSNSQPRTSVKTVREIWPNLRVFFSGGVALSSYRDLLIEQIGPSRIRVPGMDTPNIDTPNIDTPNIDAPNIDFVESYGASEGFFSFQEEPNRQDMLLHLDNGVFYEFVRMDDSSLQPARYTITDIEVGVLYRMHVTTCSGLWSYGVGDVVEFTSKTPHRIVVAGRVSEVIDKYGEAVYGDEARSALEYACRETGVTVHDYHIAPTDLGSDKMPGHQWLIEFDGNTPDLNHFSELMDFHLQSVNRHYAIRREASAFIRPEIVEVSNGTFYKWLTMSRASVSAQSKIPRMSGDRRIANEVLSISRNNTLPPVETGSNSSNAGT